MCMTVMSSGEGSPGTSGLGHLGGSGAGVAPVCGSPSKDSLAQEVMRMKMAVEAPSNFNDTPLRPARL